MAGSNVRLSFAVQMRMMPAMQLRAEPSPETRHALWAHVVPFLAWLVVMSVPVSAPAVRYAVQVVACVALMGWLRPWRYYGPVRVGHLPLAFTVGVGVCFIWIIPETSWMLRFPYLHELYLTYAVRPLGVITGYEVTSPFAPEQCGWGLSLVRLAGSALVIAAAEEFFWRGFLLRWLMNREFQHADPARVPLMMFLLAACLFGLEHDRWLVGCLAGLAYGWLYIRTRDIWAAVFAHVVTNFLLGLYVLATGSYYFW